MDYTGQTINASDYELSGKLSLPGDSPLYEVTIAGDLYREIERCANGWYTENEKAQSDPGGYSSGNKDNPSLSGAIGEVATATILYGQDNSVSQVGKPDDGWDFIYDGETYDVKTTEMSDSIWITVSDVKNGKRIEYPLKADWYVAVREERRHLKEGWMVVTVLGRVRREVVEANTEVVDGARPDHKVMKHKVRKVPFSLLEPMPEPLAGWTG